MSRKSKTGNVIDQEVANLLKMGDRANQNALLKLRSKYGDEDLVEKIQQVFLRKHTKVVKKAKAFADQVRNRYGSTGTPYSMIIQKARLHAKKHGLSSAEFAEFTRIYEQELAGTSRRSEVVLPALTNMMQTLGNLGPDMELGKLAEGVQDKEYKALQEILELQAASRPLHAQVVLQSILARGVDRETVQGYFRRALGNNGGDSVHPILAALFVPKHPELENHFLYSSIAGIVKARYNKESLSTRSDYELFYDLVTDPNDVACDNRSPINDLLHRARLQNQLWNCVLHLRNGQYYNTSFREFVANVDVCRLNKYDNPDLVYGRHDGTILKRLLSAFSFRPTVVSTLPVMGLATTNPYNVTLRPTVTRLPMVTVRSQNLPQVLPPGGTGPHRTDVPFGTRGTQIVNAASTGAGGLNAPGRTNDLSAMIKNQAQWFIEGNTIVQKQTSVLYSRGLLFVYVDRRQHRVNLGSFRPVAYDNYPVGVSGFERMNKNYLHVPAFNADLPIGIDGVSNNFKLLSAVIPTSTDVKIRDGNYAKEAIVTGSTAIIFNKNHDHGLPSAVNPVPGQTGNVAGVEVEIERQGRVEGIGGAGGSSVTEIYEYDPIGAARENLVPGSSMPQILGQLPGVRAIQELNELAPDPNLKYGVDPFQPESLSKDQRSFGDLNQLIRRCATVLVYHTQENNNNARSHV